MLTKDSIEFGKVNSINCIGLKCDNVQDIINTTESNHVTFTHDYKGPNAATHLLILQGNDMKKTYKYQILAEYYERLMSHVVISGET